MSVNNDCVSYPFLLWTKLEDYNTMSPLLCCC